MRRCTPMEPFPATEREWIIRHIADRYSHWSEHSVANVVEALQDHMRGSGCSTWTGLEPDHDSPEFWGEDRRVRPEWQEWPYHACYHTTSQGVYVGFLYPKRRPEIRWREIAEVIVAGALPPVPVQVSFLDALVPA